MSEDPGVLGNLPRSRPGRRSDKRGGAGSAAQRKTAAAAKPRAAKARTSAAKARTSAAAKSGRTQSAKTTPARPRSDARRASEARRREREQQSSGDPVSGAINAAAGLAVAGVRIPAKVAAGVIKRLPRL